MEHIPSVQPVKSCFRRFLITLGIMAVCAGGISLLCHVVKKMLVPVYVGEKARTYIGENGFTLPDSATQLYYFIGGFPQHQEFLAFSGPTLALDAVVEKKIGKKLADFEPWKGQVSVNDVFYSPANYKSDLSLKTELYDLSRVKNGLYLEDDSGYRRWYLVYDRANGRVYYNRW